MKRVAHYVLRTTTALAVVLAWVAPANATQRASLSVSLSPERLGAGTTIQFGFKLRGQRHKLPPPLTSIDLRYPANLGIVTSGLGLATCTAQRLEVYGPEGCPPNALMGRGSAIVGMNFGPEVIKERGYITIWMAPIQGGRITLVFDAEAFQPVTDYLTLPSQLETAPPPYGGSLNTSIPPIEVLPEGRNASILEMQATLGPKNITYYERKNGQRVPYQPAGIALPNKCPPHGFPFSAIFSFEDGSKTTATHAVPCPRATGRTF